jgi:hypothetical protein
MIRDMRIEIEGLILPPRRSERCCKAGLAKLDADKKP